VVTRIGVFCGSSVGNQPAFRQAAVELAGALARRGFGLVYGGARVGLMGVLADAMRQHGGEVIGVIPQALVDREIAHAGLTDLRVVGSMHERKALMVELAEALQAPVVDLGGRMNFPSTHPLCHSENRRSLVRDADVVLLLEVSDPFGQFNSISDPHKELRFVGKQGARVINVSMQDVYIRSNYQDFQRYLPVDLAINGDAQASLRAGKIIDFPAEQVSRTIADGLRTQSLGSITFEHIRRYVDDILTVKENEIREAVKLLASNPNTVAEPSGAVAVAAFLFHRGELPNTKMNVGVISGGNIDPKLLQEIRCDHAASSPSPSRKPS